MTLTTTCYLKNPMERSVGGMGGCTKLGASHVVREKEAGEVLCDSYIGICNGGGRVEIERGNACSSKTPSSGSSKKVEGSRRIIRRC
jgi:hypothetical protein